MLNPNKVQSDRRYGLSGAGPRALDLCFSELRFCINTVPGSASILMKRNQKSLTSGTPTLGCPEDTPVWSSASERCSGNEMHAAEPKTQSYTTTKQTQSTF